MHARCVFGSPTVRVWLARDVRVWLARDVRVWLARDVRMVRV